LAYDADRGLYRSWLGEAAAEYGCAIHAYVLMTNHVHLLVTPKAAESLPRTMQSLGRRYVSPFLSNDLVLEARVRREFGVREFGVRVIILRPECLRTSKADGCYSDPKFIEFGRFAQRHAGKRGRNRPETIYFLGMTLYCTQNRKGNFKVGMRTEKSRLRRSLMSLRELMRRIRHDAIQKQAGDLNAVLRGHYAYYGIAGNIRALFKVYRAVERYWRKMLCSRSWAGRHLTWSAFNQIKERTPLSRPRLHLPYRALQSFAVL